jgi:hypothetical protein
LADIEHVERYAVDKDETDLELALTAPLRLTPERLASCGSRRDASTMIAEGLSCIGCY